MLPIYSGGSRPPGVVKAMALLPDHDGLADHVRSVLPILEDIGVRGTFFVPGAVLAHRRMLCARLREEIAAEQRAQLDGPAPARETHEIARPDAHLLGVVGETAPRQLAAP